MKFVLLNMERFLNITLKTESVAQIYLTADLLQYTYRFLVENRMIDCNNALILI
jgi:hypothetical protein